MKRIARLKMLVFVFLGFAGFAQAEPIEVQVDQAVPKAGARVGVGSALTLKFPGDRAAHRGMFLGQMVKVDGRLDQMILLDLERYRINFLDRSQVAPLRGTLQRILRPYAQVDGTCTGYALHHLMAQVKQTGAFGNAALQRTFSSEEGRTQFLVRSINDYYLATQHRSSILGVLKGYGNEFGLRCEKKIYQDAASVVQYVKQKTERGVPVLISFYIGPNMATAPFTLQDLNASRRLLDSRLWVPRLIGERNSGGHSVLAVSEFEINGRPEFLMLDSDWEQPRVWDVLTYLNERTKYEELELYSCE